MSGAVAAKAARPMAEEEARESVWVMLWTSSERSASSATETVTVCGVLQLEGVKVRESGLTVRSPSGGVVIETATDACGAASSTTV